MNQHWITPAGIIRYGPPISDAPLSAEAARALRNILAANAEYRTASGATHKRKTSPMRTPD
jgi:hypothetical protein